MLKSEIGQTAGAVWNYLGRNGPVPLMGLSNKVKMSPDIVHQAIGWLAREDKVEFAEQDKMNYVSLTEAEMNNYQQIQGGSCST